ncbi:hypothetical protein cypCar_00045504, partial [Cyprinus carpio]
YLMDGVESSSESEAEDDESEEETQKPKTPEKRQTTPKKQPIKEEEEEEEDGGSTDAGGPEDDGSGMDTEDELNRVEMESRRKKAVKESASVQVKDEDPYGGSTDENTDAEEEEDKPIPELPDFLTGKRFYLYGKFPDNQKRQLQRYIIAFNGAVEDYMSEKVQFVVTSEGWDESFEEALMENGNLSFVKPTWIFAINDRQKLLPTVEMRVKLLLNDISVCSHSCIAVLGAQRSFIMSLLNVTADGVSSASPTLDSSPSLSSFLPQTNCSVSPSPSSPPYNFYAVLLVLLIFCVVFGNVLVCVAVSREKALQTTTNYLIVSLAVSDLLLATLVMPWAVYLEVVGEWRFSRIHCDILLTLDVMMCTASILNLCAISIDR